MDVCPHCGQQVDFSANTVCPNCKKPLKSESEKVVEPSPVVSRAPLSASPGAPTLGMGRTTTRTTLTGEVIEVPADPMPKYAPGAGASPVQTGGAASRPSASTAGAVNRTAYSSSQRSSKGNKGGVAAAVLFLVIAILGGGGGWYWWNHRTTPEQSTKTFLDAVANGDWTTVYNYTDLSASMKSEYPDAQSFSDHMKQMYSPQSGPAAGMMNSIKDSIKTAKIGTAAYEDGTATVPVTVSFSIMGRTIPLNIPIQLKNFGGIWKIEHNPLTGKMQGAGNMFQKSGL